MYPASIPTIPSVALTEFLAGLGFDGIFVDCEHGTASTRLPAKDFVVFA